MAKYEAKLHLDRLVAIDVHTHANISQPLPAKIHDPVLSIHVIFGR